MAEDSEYVTVYRSADANAEADANSARDRLANAGIEAFVVDDSAPGVVVGAYEVRVPAAYAARAEVVLGSAPPEAGEEEETSRVDPSHDLDLVPVFSSQNVDSEMEAQTIQSILEANDIPAFIVGSAQIPVLEFEVKVPRSRLAEAERILREAQETGPEAAEEAEQAGERAEGGSEEPV